MDIFITMSWKPIGFLKQNLKFLEFMEFMRILFEMKPRLSFYPEFHNRPRSVINVFQISGSKNGIDPEI